MWRHPRSQANYPVTSLEGSDRGLCLILQNETTPSTERNNTKCMKHFLQNPNLGSVMRVTLSQVVAMLVLTGISRAEVSFAQDALGRAVTLNVTNESLVTALKEIEEVASVRFVYSKNFVPLDRKVTINVHNQKLSTVLSKLLHPLYINYEAVNDRIVLKKLKAPPAPDDEGLQGNAGDQILFSVADFAVSGTV